MEPSSAQKWNQSQWMKLNKRRTQRRSMEQTGKAEIWQEAENSTKWCSGRQTCTKVSELLMVCSCSGGTQKSNTKTQRWEQQADLNRKQQESNHQLYLDKIPATIPQCCFTCGDQPSNEPTKCFKAASPLRLIDITWICVFNWHDILMPVNAWCKRVWHLPT